MSGIEVVGLVLGVWPVMLNVIEAWKATKGAVPELSLAGSITAYARVYRDAIAKLLQDENLSDKDRIGLLAGDKEFAAIWEDEEFEKTLRKRIDDQAFNLLQIKSQEIFDILEALKKKISSKDLDLVSRARIL
jgi:hypothetical protein